MAVVGTVLVVLGVGVAVLGLGAWARWWYAPVLRWLDGVQPFWLGGVQLFAGSALALAGTLAVLGSPEVVALFGSPEVLAAGGPAGDAARVRDTVLRWLVVMAVDTLPCLVGGLVEREHRDWTAGRRPRMNLARWVLRYLLTRQEPAGGPSVR